MNWLHSILSFALSVQQAGLLCDGNDLCMAIQTTEQVSFENDKS